MKSSHLIFFFLYYCSHTAVVVKCNKHGRNNAADVTHHDEFFEILPNETSNAFTHGSSSENDKKMVAMPYGCRCRESNVPFQDCHSFDCDCNCNLQAGECDLDCCCDPECQGEELEQFPSCHGMNSNGSSSSYHDVVKKCFRNEDGNGPEKINVRYPLRVDDSVEDAFGSMICVIKDNSAVKGDFFSNVGYPPAEMSFSLHNGGGTGIKMYDYDIMHNDYRDIESSSWSRGTHESYKIGNPIPVAFKKLPSSDSNMKQDNNANAGFVIDKLRIPVGSGGDGGLCNGLHTVEFGKNVNLGSCIQEIRSIENECETVFDIHKYVADVYVGVHGSGMGPMQNDPATDEGTFAKVYLDELRDFRGNIIDTTEKTRYNNWYERPFSKWNASASTCENAVQTLSYVIHYGISENGGRITNVAVRATTTNITMTNNKARYIEQRFGVQFLATTRATSAESNFVTRDGPGNNLIRRERSGNPGYNFGSPTLAAKLITAQDTHKYVNAYRHGMHIMNTGLQGLCETVSPAATQVGFGEDITTGCTQKFSIDELKKFCLSDSHSLLTNITTKAGTAYLPFWLVQNYDLVGIFGNADPYDRSQWLKIHFPLDNQDRILKKREWVPSLQRCNGAWTSLHYRFLWTYAGNVQNPQAKIISAQIDYNQNYLQHTLKTASPSETQSHAFTTTVTWTYESGQKSFVKPPRPTLLFAVPHDIFYPFQIESSGIAPFFRGELWWCFKFISTMFCMI